VTITHNLKVVVADPDDDKIVECAVVGGATHIVTGDRRHLLPMGSYQGISIISPADFLQLLSQL
jgi:predicted nucleic acid-binding protein